MDPIDLSQLNPSATEQCFFTKILRECSQNNLDHPQNSSPFLSPMLMPTKIQQQQQNQTIDQFLKWKGLQQPHEEQTNTQPRLVRAQSMRMEQQRKVRSFIDVFGVQAIDPATGMLRAFSPQKHKRIGKGKK